MEPVQIVLWTMQILLAIGFAVIGYGHMFRFERMAAQPGTAWMSVVGPERMRIIGALEIAGAIGLILPWATGILPWLTPLAAALLALLMVFAIIFHTTRREWPNIAFNAILGVLAAIVAYGRFVVAPFS